MGPHGAAAAAAQGQPGSGWHGQHPPEDAAPWLAEAAPWEAALWTCALW